ncbi:hypothetical protein FB567DRAFT_623726 [Paraphoma chrysanthemicola]|uniref:RNA polymerase II assembly factor Rtp1 C-terminal domain-containing protein n=1 Tax=Paraphoma chrysanthemicola TaxID=798071 RepID=A0A8K0RJ68_9PLEO|nr:hypothetical protein FB567DRAFT_623726 [Paraphoma chrysanthemicola]
MGAVEDAVDAAAGFLEPFLETSTRKNVKDDTGLDATELVNEALAHLQSINSADLVADPDAPYDASLAGVVYGLLDLITSLGLLPHLSPGVAFGQRPRSVLRIITVSSSSHDQCILLRVVEVFLAILEQNGSGVQPLLSQRNLPDIIVALAELSFSPTTPETHLKFRPGYDKIIASTPTSRLLPLLTALLQQPLPAWLKPQMSKELAMVPLRQHGVRHTIEFLSLSYLSKNSKVPQDASGPQSQIAIPLEAVTQAARLLVLPPNGMDQDVWLRQLAPQIWSLLDGSEGKELSRAAGQIIAGGILSKKAIGAPGTVGWELFAQPLLSAVSPGNVEERSTIQSTSKETRVQESELIIALRRLSAIALAYSHAGVLKRLLGPLVLSLWALLNYAEARPALNKQWAILAKSILVQYFTVTGDPRQVDKIATNLFWDGEPSWTFGPGSEGGVEIRQRSSGDGRELGEMDIFTRLQSLDTRIELLVKLLSESKVTDDMVGMIFLTSTKRWLSEPTDSKPSLTGETQIDPLAAYTDARLVQVLASTFSEEIARSPEHIIELMGQLLSNYVSEHRSKVQSLTKRSQSTRAQLRHIVQHDAEADPFDSGSSSSMGEEIASFAISILRTLMTASGFKQTPSINLVLASVATSLVYLSQEPPEHAVPALITNSANDLLHLIQPAATPTHNQTKDSLSEHHATMKTVLADLTSPEPPNRTWALNTVHKLIRDSAAFPVVDVPSLTHLLLSASLADPESYVHTAAVPVLVDLAIRAPILVSRILVDAFIDIDEKSLKLGRGKRTEEKDTELQHALDFRLRVGEVLNSLALEDSYWAAGGDVRARHACLKLIVEACLSLASRRGQRIETLSRRTQVAQAEQRVQDEAEAAWGGPIPNLLDPDGDDAKDRAERDALVKIVQGWQDTGVEEDVRIRASALSVLSTVLEHRLALLRQVTVDAVLQMALLILTMETSEAHGILRRAGVLVFMGLLRGLDSALEAREETVAGLSASQGEEVERVLKWIRDEDVDALVRDHATNVLEGLETLRMKKLYMLRDDGLQLSADLGLEGNLRGLDVRPDVDMGRREGRKLMVEEVE